MNINIRQLSWILLFILHTNSPMDPAAVPNSEHVRGTEIIGTVINSFHALHELLAHARENAANFENQVRPLNEALENVRVATNTLPNLLSPRASSLAMNEQYARLEVLLEHAIAHLNQAHLIFRVAPRVLAEHHDGSVVVTMVNSALLEVQYAQEFIERFFKLLATIDQQEGNTSGMLHPLQEAADGILHLVQSPEATTYLERAGLLNLQETIPAIARTSLATFHLARKNHLAQQDPTLLLSSLDSAEPGASAAARAPEEPLHLGTIVAGAEPVREFCNKHTPALLEFIRRTREETSSDTAEEDAPLTHTDVLDSARTAHTFCATHMPKVAEYLKKYSEDDLTRRKIASDIDFALQPPAGSTTLGAVAWNPSFLLSPFAGFYVPGETEPEKEARLALEQRYQKQEITKEQYEREAKELKKVLSERYKKEKASTVDGFKRYASSVAGLSEAIGQDFDITPEQREAANKKVQKLLRKATKILKDQPVHVEQATSVLQTGITWAGSALTGLQALANHPERIKNTVHWFDETMGFLTKLTHHQQEIAHEEKAIIARLKTLGLHAQEQLAEHGLARRDPP